MKIRAIRNTSRRVDAVLKEGPAVDSVKKAICHSILLRRRSFGWDDQQ